MLQSKAFANAATVVVAVFYVVCVIVSYVGADLLFSLTQSWVHSLNLQAIRSTSPMSVDSVVYGLVTVSLLTWVTSYALIGLYNRFTK